MVARAASAAGDEGLLRAGRVSEGASVPGEVGRDDEPGRTSVERDASIRRFRNDTIEETADGEFGDTGLAELLGSPGPGADVMPSAPPRIGLAIRLPSEPDANASPGARGVTDDGSASRRWTPTGAPAALVALGSADDDAADAGDPIERLTCGTAEEGSAPGPAGSDVAASAGAFCLDVAATRAAVVVAGAASCVACTAVGEGGAGGRAEDAMVCSRRMNRGGAGHISVADDGTLNAAGASALDASIVREASPLLAPTPPPTRSSTDRASIPGSLAAASAPVRSEPPAGDSGTDALPPPDCVASAFEDGSSAVAV